MTMSYLAGGQMSMSNVTTADGLSMLPLDLPLDNLDHHSNFDAETYAGYAPGQGILTYTRMLISP